MSGKIIPAVVAVSACSRPPAWRPPRLRLPKASASVQARTRALPSRASLQLPYAQFNGYYNMAPTDRYLYGRRRGDAGRPKTGLCGNLAAEFSEATAAPCAAVAFSRAAPRTAHERCRSPTPAGPHNVRPPRCPMCKPRLRHALTLHRRPPRSDTKASEETVELAGSCRRELGSATARRNSAGRSEAPNAADGGHADDGAIYRDQGGQSGLPAVLPDGRFLRIVLRGRRNRRARARHRADQARQASRAATFRCAACRSSAPTNICTG